MVQTYVLSLKSSRDRRLAVQSQFDRYGLPFQFFDALGDAAADATLLHNHYDSEMNRKHFKRPMSSPEGYCYLGHRAIWQHLADSDEDVAMVLEDDFRFVADPRPMLAASASKNLRGVMIKLDGGSEIEGTTIGKMGKAALVQRKVLTARTTGYLIGRDAAKSLLASSERFYRPIDLDLKHFWEHGVPIFLLKPAVVCERDDCASLLSTDRKTLKPASQFLRFLKNLKYQLAFRYGLLRNSCNEAQSPFLSKNGKTG
ncbi:glycosyltransferase family 25 protein [Ruegeria sediminis]|uniref:Glycosyltransferase family 25 protein n=1 Tax=Ruegeria sediminis TaxID=2583820 RepID=A0ABY2WV68_9RHOB|nr:glycosyltransferase family 25 protein [Ruegeria sediminis]TMV05664.1 glycosyltransferase family 25 protein [Ruegeria sediminis]